MLEKYALGEDVLLGLNGMIQRKKVKECENAITKMVSNADNDESSDKNGFYYGKNAISDNDILFDRKHSMPPHGLIVGSAGTGKTFAVVQEIEQVLDKTDDSVIIIGRVDAYLSDESRVVSISPYDSISPYHINPLDLYITDKDEEASAAISVVAKNTIMLFEELICRSMTPAERCVVDNGVMRLFEPFVKRLKEHKIKCDYVNNPTLSDIAELLLSEDKAELLYELREKETVIKEYFSYKTFIPDNRAVILTWKDEPHLNSALYAGCVMFSWNSLLKKSEEQKYLWIYLEEFGSLLGNDTVNTIKLVYGLFKRSRRYGGIVTLITQSVEQLIKNEECNAFFDQAGFIRCMSCQNISDRKCIGELFGLNDEMLDYIHNAPVGGGLFIAPRLVIPVSNSFLNLG